MEYDRILLINPAASKWQQHRVRQRTVPLGLPLGLGFLASFLEEKGINAQVYDEQIEPLDGSGFVRTIKEGDIKLVGITTMTLVLHRAMEIAKEVKQISKDIKVILGGVHPTVMPTECLKNDDVDVVVRQEGEITLWDCIRSFMGEVDLQDVKGLSGKDNGKIFHNPDRPVIEDLDSLPPFPFHLFDKHLDKYNFNLLSSRGCPFRCIFCSARSVSGHKYRYRSPENVIRDIDLLVNKYGIKNITFHDDNFTFNKKRVEKLRDLIIQKGFHKDVRFYCLTRSDMVDRDILEKMKEAGFLGIYFGIETASNRLMKLINKGETVEDNIKAVKLAKEIGFKVRGAFMLGFPTETPEETRQTIKLARKLPLDFVSFSLATPFPGTKLYDFAKEEGYRDYDFSRFNVLEGLSGKLPPYTPNGRKPEELMRLQKWAYFRFYLSPHRLLKFLKMGLPEMNLRGFRLLDRVRIGLNIVMKLLRRD